MTRVMHLVRDLYDTRHSYCIPLTTTSIFIRTFTQVCISLTRKLHPSPCPVLLVILTRHLWTRFVPFNYALSPIVKLTFPHDVSILHLSYSFLIGRTHRVTAFKRIAELQQG